MVHDEAERLEHYISERFEDRIAAILGDPEMDPHGHVIPRKDQAGRYRDEVPLAGWPVRKQASVTSVADHDPAVLRELERAGLRPGTSLKVHSKIEGVAILLRAGSAKGLIRLSHEVATCVFVAEALTEGPATSS